MLWEGPKEAPRVRDGTFVTSERSSQWYCIRIDLLIPGWTPTPPHPPGYHHPYTVPTPSGCREEDKYAYLAERVNAASQAA